MRATFIRTLVEAATEDPRIMLLTGDLGFTVVEPFAERFPERFINAGVAEQNMVGVATGLAEAGFVPYVYSIATFAALRPFEFIRNGPILHDLPVRIVGVGGGLEYGANGVTHYALEDIALMRTQPGMTLIAPADHEQARSALLATSSVDGPIYFRLGKDESSTIPGLGGRFELGRAEHIGVGAEIAVIATGAITREAASAVETLTKAGLGASLLVVACLSPPPTEDIVAAIASARLVVTVESHYLAGGLGSLVSEIVAEHELSTRVVRCGLSSIPRLTGSERFLNDLHGLSASALVARTMEALEGTLRPEASEAAR